MYTVSQKATRPHLGKGRSEVKKQGLLISAEMLSGEGAASTASSFLRTAAGYTISTPLLIRTGSKEITALFLSFRKKR